MSRVAACCHVECSEDQLELCDCRFISVKYKSLDELPEGAVIGSAALRRQAQLLNRFPTLKIVNFRGNVQSRIRKLQEGQVSTSSNRHAALQP